MNSELFSDSKIEDNPFIEKRYNQLYKIILIGDTNVGKTSIISKYLTGVFPQPQNSIPTIAAEFATKIIQIKEGGYIKAQIWDTAGQEKYKSITSYHYRKAVGALLVYDISRKNTFNNCINWYNELKKYTNNCVICLIGNKNDISENKREVSFNEGNEFANKKNMIFFEISAKNKNDVENCFNILIQEIYNFRKKNNKGEAIDSIIIQKGDFQNYNNGCC
jgi:Rab family protein